MVERIRQFLYLLTFGPGTSTEKTTHTGYRDLTDRICKEWKRPTYGLLRLVRLGILVSRYVSPTVLIDSAVNAKKDSMVGVSREVMYFLRLAFFLLVLLTRLHGYKIVFGIVVFLILDIISSLLGTAFLWGTYSLDRQRSLILAISNYFEITLAFAVLYLHCDCLSVKNLCASQALYFSLVTAATVGYGDLVPNGTQGRWLVICQICVFVIFVLVILAILTSRAQQDDGGTA
jgi:hypothetical protein